MHTTITGLVLALVLTSSASAASASIAGTQAEVRTFCVGEDAFILEGGNFTLCLTTDTDIVCRNDNVCSSSDLDLATAAGFKRHVVADL